jgi:hypothetical protein
MKLIKLLYIILLLSLVELNSQGFDWQYSARLPFETPVFFIGLTGEADFTRSFASLPLTERDYRPCCDFKDRWGFSGSAGMNFEYWMRDYSIFTKVMFGYYETVFDEKGIPYPMRYDNPFQSEYKISTYIKQIIIEPGIRYRLFDTYLSLNGSLRASFIINNSYHVSDSKAIVDDTYSPRIPDLNSIYLQLHVGLGYDFSTGLGNYSTISIYSGLPITGLSQKGSWYPMSIGLGFTYNNGI